MVLVSMTESEAGRERSEDSAASPGDQAPSNGGGTPQQAAYLLRGDRKAVDGNSPQRGRSLLRGFDEAYPGPSRLVAGPSSCDGCGLQEASRLRPCWPRLFTGEKA